MGNDDGEAFFRQTSNLSKWPGMCPGNNERVGKKSGPTPTANRWLRQVRWCNRRGEPAGARTAGGRRNTEDWRRGEERKRALIAVRACDLSDLVSLAERAVRVRRSGSQRSGSAASPSADPTRSDARSLSRIHRDTHRVPGTKPNFQGRDAECAEKPRRVVATRQ